MAYEQALSRLRQQLRDAGTAVDNRRYVEAADITIAGLNQFLDDTAEMHHRRATINEISDYLNSVYSALTIAQMSHDAASQHVTLRGPHKDVIEAESARMAKSIVKTAIDYLAGA